MGAPGLDVAGLDSVAIASGYGMRARRVEGSDELRNALAEAIASGAPELIEVRIAPGMSLGDGPGVKLLEPDVTRIAPEAAAPAEDRVPDSLATGTPEPLRSDLIALLGADRVLGARVGPGALRLRREPLPHDPEVGRDGARCR